MIRPAAIRISAGERWLGATAPIGRVSRTMALIAGASVLGHLAVVSVVAVTARADVAPPTEIAVEIVQEVPKPTPEPAKKPEPAKPEPARAEAQKPAPPKVEPPKSEPERAEAPKPEPTKPQPPPPKPAKAAHKFAAAKAPQPQPDEAEEARKLAALQREFESLRAEQAQLRAERAAMAAAEQRPQPTPVAMRDTGLGLLPNSFQAVALPNTTDGAGEATSYEELVFSALAKAKGIGRRQGVPGTAGLRFSVDAAGKLVAVELIRWSGIPDLDSEALALVRRAVFPPPPQGAQRTFVANVNFEAERAR